jgi:hypothetical protein
VAGNPIKHVDPTGKIVRPINKETLKVIQNTLNKEDIKYVRFDANGNIDRDYLNSHSSKSGNYAALLELVNSNIVINVSLSENVEYMDNEGNMRTKAFIYQEADFEFADPEGNTIGGTSTGEAGYMGQTLMPGQGKSGMNSPDNSVKVIINKNLSDPARAELYSHEANGHALIYVQTGSREKAIHHPPADGTWRETNTLLMDYIIKSKQETINNMRSR